MITTKIKPGMNAISPFKCVENTLPTSWLVAHGLNRERSHDEKGNVSRRQTIHSLKALSRISNVQSGWTMWCDRCTFWHLPLWGYIFSIPMKARPSSHQQVLCLGVTKLHSNCLGLVPDRFIMFHPSWSSWLQPKLSLGWMQSHLSSVLRAPFQLRGLWPMGSTEKGVTTKTLISACLLPLPFRQRAKLLILRVPRPLDASGGFCLDFISELQAQCLSRVTAGFFPFVQSVLPHSSPALEGLL